MGKLYFGDAFIRIRNRTGVRVDLVKIETKLAQLVGYRDGLKVAIVADQNGLFYEPDVEWVIEMLNDG